MQSQASVPPTNLSHQGRLRGCSSLGSAIRAQSQREDLWGKDFRGCYGFQKAVGRLQGLMGRQLGSGPNRRDDKDGSEAGDGCQGVGGSHSGMK